MKVIGYIILTILLFGKCYAQTAQVNDAVKRIKTQRDSSIDSANQKDLIDVVHKIMRIKPSAGDQKNIHKVEISVVPSIGYTLSTGFAGDITGNAAFYTSPLHDAKQSVIDADVAYDVKTQKIFLTRSELWFEKNNYKFISELRWEEFPEDTYGLGTSTKPVSAVPIVFNYLKNIYYPL